MDVPQVGESAHSPVAGEHVDIAAQERVPSGIEPTSTSLAGLDLPPWVGPQLEQALRACEKGFETAWLLSEKVDELASALRETESRIYDLEVISRLELARADLEGLVEDSVDALKRLSRAVPDPEEIEAWAKSLDAARTAVRRYLVHRQYFKLRLGGDMRTVKI